MKEITLAMKELANRYNEHYGQSRVAASEHSPSENFRLSDYTEKSSGLFIKSRQGLPNDENFKKLLFGLKGETALKKIMEKAQKMPLE